MSESNDGKLSQASLEQQQLLPSGCQIWNRHVLACSPSGNLIAYASTMGICILDKSTNTVSLKRVLVNHESSHKPVDNIVGIAWHPTDEDVLLSTSEVDIMIWNLSATRPCQSVTALPKPIVRASWCLHDASIVAVSCINARVYEWEVGSAIFRECYSRPSKVAIKNSKQTESNVATALAWHPVNAQLLCGHFDGTWTVWDKQSKSIAFPGNNQFTKTSQTSSRVVDLNWEKLGGSYALITYKSQHIILWDVLVQVELKVFELAAPGLRWVVWLDFSPGSFVTFCDSQPHAALWNVSQATPMDEIKIMSSMKVGVETVNDLPTANDALRIHAVMPIPGNGGQRSTSMFLSLVDGSVAIWSWKQRCIVWRSTPGHTETIFHVSYNPQNPNELATSSYDGSIIIWHTPSLTITKVLHTIDVRLLPETLNTNAAAASEGFGSILYSVEWSPNGQELVAASFSGSVFIFDALSGDIKVHLEQLHAGPCFKCDWYQGKGCDDNGLIASSGGDGQVVLFDKRGVILNSINASKGCFGCHWSPFSGKDCAYLAVGSVTAEVFIFEVNLSGVVEPSGKRKTRCLYVLRGHSQRVFHVTWSPLVPGLLASGSDDASVRVWLLDLQLSQSSVSQTSAAQLMVSFARVLEGHGSRVRPLVWSHEIPSLLLTSGWDCCIKLWDVSCGTLLSSIEHHSADVYGLASHPERPFEFVSCSRDNTLRFWKFDCPTLSKAKLNCLVKNVLPEGLIAEAPSGKDLLRFTTNDKSNVNRDASNPFPMILAGKASRRLFELLQKQHHFEDDDGSASINTLATSPAVWREMMCLWYGFDQEDLWYLLGAAVGKGSGPEPSFQRFINSDRILEMKHTQALLLESYRAGLTSKAHRKDSGVSGLKKKHALLMAAEIHLKCGKFEDACRILVEIEEWQKALLLAPAVSLEHWRKLLSDYARVTGGSNSSQTLPWFSTPDIYLLLASGRVEHVINLLVHRMQFMDALIVSCSYLEGRFDVSSLTLSAAASQESKYDDKHAEGRKAMEVVCSLMAKQYIESTRAISGACMLMGAGCNQYAAEALIRGNHIDTAFALASCFAPSERWAVHLRKVLLYALAIRSQGLGDKVQSLELMKLAASIRCDCVFSSIIDVELYATLLASDVGCSESERRKLLLLGGVRKTEREFVEEALDEEKKTSPDMIKVVRNYLLAFRHADAVEILLRKDGLLEQLSQQWATWKDLDECTQRPPETLLAITSLVYHVNGLILSNTIQKRNFVGWTCWLGGWLAETYSNSWIPGIRLQGIAAALYRRARCIGMTGAPQHAFLLAEAGCMLRDEHRNHSARQAEALIAKASHMNVSNPKDVCIIEGAETWVSRYMKQQADAAEEAAALVSPHDRHETVENVVNSSSNSIVRGRASPCGSSVPVKKMNISKSLLDDEFISGPALILEDGVSVVSAADAVMWSWVNPFSPLASGERMYAL